jgi:putative SOS response-associated peptidase YedK
MCGRFTLRTPADELARWFTDWHCPDLVSPDRVLLRPRFNIAPTQNVWAIRSTTRHRGCEWVMLRWGLVPSWLKSLTGPPLINARAETVAEKPSFRTAFRRRRCLIPADGFYEWQALTPKLKQPQYITLRSNQPFAFAGLWESWQAPDGSRIESCTILTTSANALMQQFHDRMPVILTPEEFAPWLDPELTEPAAVLPMLDEYPPEAMTACPVSTRVNSIQNDSPELIVPSE